MLLNICPSFTRIAAIVIRGGIYSGVVVSLLSGCTSPAQRQTVQPSVVPAELPQTSPWEITAQCAALGKCMNLGNALDAPTEGAWGVTLQESYFSHVKKIGFNSVRIPVRWSAHIDSTAPWGIDSVFFNRVTWAIEQARANGLRAIVNVHHYETLMSDLDGQRPVFLAIWRQIAERYSGYGPEVYFELCNEPNGALTPAAWNTLAKEALAVVRESNPRRSVLIGPGNWNSIGSIESLELPPDSFIIATVHYYEPMQFTHQGASWIRGTASWIGTRWRGEHQDTLTVMSHFDKVTGWSERNGIPVFLGEFGALDSADTVSRVLYTSFIAKQAVHRGWSYAYWKYSGNFGIYDDSTGITHDELVAALLRPGTTFSSWMKTALADTTPADPGSDRYLLLDDFEDSLPERNGLYPIGVARGVIGADAPCCGWSVWYLAPSVITDGNGSRIISVQNVGNAGRKANFGQLIGNWGSTGKGLYARGLVKGDNYPSLNFSTPLLGSYNKDWFDLSTLTAITFRAKGHGRMRVNFITDTILNGYPQGENWGHFGSDFGLTPEWKLYTFPVSSIQPKPWSRPQQEELPWSAAMKKVCSVEFATSQNYDRVADDTIEIYLDDIRLYGLTEEALGLNP